MISTESLFFALYFRKNSEMPLKDKNVIPHWITQGKSVTSDTSHSESISEVFNSQFNANYGFRAFALAIQ
ncbi:MAG: hypothetical protein WCG50_18390, partial [Rhodoferax sp.]